MSLLACISSKKNGLLPIHKDDNFMTLSKLAKAVLECEEELNTMIVESSDIAQFHNSVTQFILGKVGSASNAMALTIAQCLLKTLVIKGEEYVQLYAAWNNHITKETS